MQRNCFRAEGSDQTYIVPNIDLNMDFALISKVWLLKECLFLSEKLVIFQMVWHLGIECIPMRGVLRAIWVPNMKNIR